MTKLESVRPVARRAVGKAVLDVVVATTALLLAAPVLIAAALFIKTVSRGPVLFAQQRIGKDQAPFRILKLRTMHCSASEHALGSVTIRNDPRLIPGGVWLRKLKVDELPQLINVLNGTMSLVGPRPTVAEDYQRMDSRQRGRATLKPGITGLAQVRGGAAMLWPERIELDLRYIENHGLRLDLSILVETAWLLLRGAADTNPVKGDEWGGPSQQTEQAA